MYKTGTVFNNCKNCCNYFAVSSYVNTGYWDREYGGNGRTCKEIGAAQTYKKKTQTDPFIKEYTR